MKCITYLMVYICIYSSYIGLFNVNSIPFFIKKESLNHKYTKADYYLCIVVATYVLTNPQNITQSYENQWEELKQVYAYLNEL
jgi:hypothetical protein